MGTLALKTSRWSLSRLEAVLETCDHFITESRMNTSDTYSFITFNEESVLNFSCLSAIDAAIALKSVTAVPQRQTFYAMGVRGIEAAIRRDKEKRPTHVIFLSDGEPTDPDSYSKDLHVLRRKHAGEELRIYTVGFGESAKVNEREEDFIYLQQLASVGRGHFQRCGASLTSLQERPNIIRMYVCIYIYITICVCVYICVYIYIYRERDICRCM